MNAKERYLAVLDDNKRKELDRVPTFVQYIRPEFVELHQQKFVNMRVPFKSDISRFKDAYLMGFESVFANFHPGLRVSRVEVEDEKGEKVLVAWNGQPPMKRMGYYKRGLFFSIDNLNKVRETMRKVDDSAEIQKTMDHYERISSYIFPVIEIGGIFDTLWQSMGFKNFSYHHRKNSKLYRELVKYFAELTLIRVQSIIDATGSRAGVLNINDDIAFKGRSMISPERWEQDIGIYYKEICSIISDAGMKTTMHTDGDITTLLDFIVESGFDALQCLELPLVDPRYVKKKVGDKLCLIGNIDTKHILVEASKEEVEEAVKDAIKDMGYGGGFMISSSNFHPGMKIDRIKWMVEAGKKFGVYPLNQNIN